MSKNSPERLKKIVDSFQNKKILVLGDFMLDKYVWGEVTRISPEAPVPILKVQSENCRLGGAANVAHNLVSLGIHPLAVSVIGRDSDGESLIDLLKQNKIETNGIIIDENRPTTTKTRIVAHHQQMIRVDKETTYSLGHGLEQKMLVHIAAQIPEVHAILISDYGKGVLSRKLITAVLQMAVKNKKFVAVDPKEPNFPFYRRASILTPNHHEAENMVNQKIKDQSSLQSVGKAILDKWSLEALLITQGADGMTLFDKTGTFIHLPAMASKVFDVTGAGDTVISVFTAAITAGAKLEEAAFLSNLAAGLVVKEIGTAAVDAQQLVLALKPAKK